MMRTLPVLSFSLAILWLSEVAAASTISPEFVAPAIDDAVVVDNNGDGTFETLLEPLPPQRLEIKRQATPGSLESRVLLKFDLGNRADEPVGKTRFDFFIDLTTHSSAPVNLYGFVSDGSLDLADADRPGILLGSYDADQIGLLEQSIVLRTSAVQQLITPGVQTIELRLEASSPLVETSIDKVTPLFASAPPQLRIGTVPEPASVGLLASTILSVGRRRRS